jgi:hypothetical protein
MCRPDQWPEPYQRSQCTIVSSGARGAGLKSVPWV